MPSTTADGAEPPRATRVAVVGAGFGGIAVAAGLDRAGYHDYVLLERADDVGGTWRDNTYPGCQCDVPSTLYSLSFAPNAEWRRTYATQPEIQRYLQRTVDELGIRPRIRFGCELLDATWDDAAQRWHLRTSTGEVTCEVLVAAQGPLSEPATPDIPGLDRFAGTTFHTASWRHDHELAGRRVAVIGTGSTAVQAIPHLQEVVEHLTVLQRTPAWVLPHTDRAVTDLERSVYRRFPPVQKAMRGAVYAFRELIALGMTKRPALLEPLRRASTAHLARAVADPELRAKLTPRFSPGCKRLLLSDRYYPALAQPNVDVVTEAITEITETAVVTTDGTAHEVDTVVLATGFLATEPPIARRLHGRDGRTLAEAWADRGMHAYLGTTVPGFPNLFLLAGPNTGIGHTSLLYMIESQVPYVVGAVELLAERHVGAVEVRADVADAYEAEVQEKMGDTVWTTGGCSSWYLDRHGRNTTLWPDLTFRFRRRTRRFDAKHYDLVLRRRQPAPTATTTDTGAS
jgi:cation diffusion facilitator CzcD-associated flavoprotein CzcO